MPWLIVGIALALVSISATSLGGLATGLLMLAVSAWLVIAFRPVAMGALVANWSRRRFE
jgi:hypothetical protein